METAILTDSDRAGKRYMVKIGDKTIHFGSSDHDSYPFHKDPKRKELYIQRHKKRENWTKSGVFTPGFWAKHVLWGKPTIFGSLKDISELFNIRVRDDRKIKLPK
tara:strand:+ start:571 stop:885 length:315 start_codon:yes stop_codon:yes gene_type:complete